MAPRAWIIGSMQLCSVLILVISCRHQVSYINIKRWRKSQNITRSLWWVALHFLIFQLSVNESWGTGFSMEMSYVSDKKIHHIQHYKESGNYCCCFLSQKILISSSSFHSWTWELTRNWKTWMKHIVAPLLQHVWDFYELFWIKNLNKKSAFAC